jgi:nitrogen fixation-related uncharacterized protein
MNILGMRIPGIVLLLALAVVAYFVFVKGKQNDPLKGLMGS